MNGMVAQWVSACCEARLPDFDSWNPHTGRMREPTLQMCGQHMCVVVPAFHQPTLKKEKSLIESVSHRNFHYISVNSCCVTNPPHSNDLM